MRLSRNFKLSEWKCHDGTPVPKRLIPNARRCAQSLQVLRDFYGKAVRITSGYRTPSYNRSVGGARRSQHKKAKAADIWIKGVSPDEVARTIRRLIRAGCMDQGGVGVYPKSGFVHYDVRGKPARWRGS